MEHLISGLAVAPTQGGSMALTQAQLDKVRLRLI
jgi:hypothetical protein